LSANGAFSFPAWGNAQGIVFKKRGALKARINGNLALPFETRLQR
jgi:hypothetical protein